MNYCPEYESRILDYDELSGAERALADAHIAGCEGCRAFAAALAVVDESLSVAVHRAFASVAPPVRPPLWPELLDLAGWASLMAALIAVAVILAPPNLRDAALWFALGLMIAAGSAWFGFKSWRELSS